MRIEYTYYGLEYSGLTLVPAQFGSDNDLTLLSRHLQNHQDMYSFKVDYILQAYFRVFFYPKSRNIKLERIFFHFTGPIVSEFL